MARSISLQIEAAPPASAGSLAAATTLQCLDKGAAPALIALPAMAAAHSEAVNVASFLHMLGTL
jgi:hypothetical protein